MVDKIMNELNVDNLTANILKYESDSDIISVTQLNNLAKSLIENNLPVFWIKGEISGIRNYSHVYFDLKDLSSKISCVIFSRIVNNLEFKLENGQQIEVRGKVTIYPGNGSYQINVERIRQVGLGELWEAYNKLLNKLKIEGLFNTEYKKSLPLFPRSVGVITSKEGSVIRDVMTTLKRRMPNIQIIIYHSAVQGMDASMQIVQALRQANSRNEVDVLIVCRGGGSMQDLWCFNEEVVAREVFASSIPIISAIGHETDTTIIDYVADLRAPTPTAAAELVAIGRDEWLHKISKLYNQLQNKFNVIVNNKKQQLDSYYITLRYLNPINQIKEKLQSLKIIQFELNEHINNLIKNNTAKISFYENKLSLNKIDIRKYKDNLVNLEIHLKKSLKYNYLIKNNTLNSLEKELNLLNPNNVLGRGYAIVRNKAGKIIVNNKAIKNHERLSIQFVDSKASAIADKNYNPNQEELI